VRSGKDGRGEDSSSRKRISLLGTGVVRLAIVCRGMVRPERYGLVRSSWVRVGLERQELARKCGERSGPEWSGKESQG